MLRRAAACCSPLWSVTQFETVLRLGGFVIIGMAAPPALLFGVRRNSRFGARAEAAEARPFAAGSLAAAARAVPRGLSELDLNR